MPRSRRHRTDRRGIIQGNPNLSIKSATILDLPAERFIERALYEHAVTLGDATDDPIRDAVVVRGGMGAVRALAKRPARTCGRGHRR